MLKLNSHRGDRLLRGAVVAFLLLVTSGCTTSKAVRAWHDGWRAERKGDFERASKRYSWAYGRDGALVGAELGRLRILAIQPDQAEAVSKALKTLIKKKGDQVSVQLFATGWALTQRDLPLAVKRLAGIHQVAIDKADAPFLLRRGDKPSPGKADGASSKAPSQVGTLTATGAPALDATNGAAESGTASRVASATPLCGPFTIAWQRLRLRVFSRSGDFQQAAAAGRELMGRCRTGSAGIALDLARAHLGLGQVRRARRMLGRRARGARAVPSPQIRALSAEIAFALDEPQRVERLLTRRSDARALALRAWAAWRAGKHRRAVARAARAIRADTKQELAVEVQVAAAIASNELDLAQGILRGAASLLGMDPWTLAFADGILAVRAGKLMNAERAFQRAVARCPTCRAPKKNLAVLRRALGKQPVQPQPMVAPTH